MTRRPYAGVVTDEGPEPLGRTRRPSLSAIGEVASVSMHA